MAYRRPQRTLLQAALREAERSLSGALFLLFPSSSTEQKRELRARLVAGLCHGLILRKQLTMLQAEKQLSTTQLSFLSALSTDPGTALQQLWQPYDRSNLGRLASWTELGVAYVAKRLRREPDPPAVDWGQREQELRGLLSSYPGEVSVELKEGRLKIVDGRKVSAEAPLEVIGTYTGTEKLYRAGWADQSVEPGARPLPVPGCASQLFRLDLTTARSEARRAAWLSHTSYLLEFTQGDRLSFLGFEKPQPRKTANTFQTADLRPEMLARFKAVEQALKIRQPERLKDLFLSQSQEVERLLSLFENNTNGELKVQKTADTLRAMGDSITTRTLLGGNRSHLRSRESERLLNSIQSLQELWEGNS
jgi:hypothetical protein